MLFEQLTFVVEETGLVIIKSDNFIKNDFYQNEWKNMRKGELYYVHCNFYYAFYLSNNFIIIEIIYVLMTLCSLIYIIELNFYKIKLSFIKYNFIFTKYITIFIMILSSIKYNCIFIKYIIIFIMLWLFKINY